MPHAYYKGHSLCPSALARWRHPAGHILGAWGMVHTAAHGWSLRYIRVQALPHVGKATEKSAAWWLSGSRTVPHACPFPMPHAPYPMPIPHAPCPMSHAPCPMPHAHAPGGLLHAPRPIPHSHALCPRWLTAPLRAKAKFYCKTDDDSLVHLAHLRAALLAALAQVQCVLGGWHIVVGAGAVGVVVRMVSVVSTVASMLTVLTNSMYDYYLRLQPHLPTVAGPRHAHDVLVHSLARLAARLPLPGMQP